MSSKISQEEKGRLKGTGFIPQKDGEHFACRVITGDGCLNSYEINKLADIAQRYGRGYVSYTTRLTVEIPWIKYEEIEAVKEELGDAGLYAGGTGPRVRPIVACKGTVCVFGLLDTQEFARKLHEKFYLGYYDMVLPHKFKIGIGGCPNNCIKPDLNDFGIMGQRVPELKRELCLGCKKCGVEEVCRLKAAKVDGGKLNIDTVKCNSCGLCIGKCHFDALKSKMEGVKLFIGGKWGKVPKRGQVLEGVYTLKETVDILEKSILYYRENGKKGERFGDMIDRIGFEEVSRKIR